MKLRPRGLTVAGGPGGPQEESDGGPDKNGAFLNGLEGCGRTNTALGCEMPAGVGRLKLLSCEGLRDPPPLPDPDPEHALDPEPEADPESADEVERAEDRYVGGTVVGWQPPGWHPGPLQLDPPSMEEVVVLAQLKSPMVEGGPSDSGGP